jgi:NAD(P)-dependent dehydrogenase (short-subunit alcohol dehydrogenase family)
MISDSNIPGVALVTAGGQRIGAEIARALAAAGFAVVIHHRGGGPQAEALAHDIQVGGGRAATIHADLENRSERSTLVDRAASHFGRLTALVNNASSFAPDSVTDLDEDLWDRHFAIHAEAPAFLARDFARQLPEGTQGNIVNIIDERVIHLAPAYFSYTLSKAALWAMTQTMAQSLAPRIRVNAIGPGPTLQEAGQTEAAFKQAQRRLPLGYGASATDIANAVLFLIRSSAITGQLLALDGGQHLSFPERRGPTPRQAQP